MIPIATSSVKAIPNPDVRPRTLSVLAEPPNGVPISGYPSWMERSMLVMTNVCRLDPTGYRDFYLAGAGDILSPTHYPAVAPLRFADGLNRSARFHSEDMATANYLTHNDPSGRTWAERIASFYPDWALLGENIAGGFSGPIQVIGGLIADPANGAPAPDGSGLDGHRWNIMFAQYTHVGCGFAQGPSSTYQYYYTQDFARAQAVGVPASPIASGSHVFLGGATIFLVNAVGDLSHGSVVIDGVRNPVAPHLTGTYRFSIPTSAAIHRYYFEFADGEAVYRYPEFGEFTTDGGYNDSPDFDRDGTVNIGDLFQFLNAMRNGDPRADFHRTGAPKASDVLDYVSAWFRGGQ